MIVDLCFNSSTTVRHSVFGNEYYQVVVTITLANKT